MEKTLNTIISDFGSRAKAKLDNAAVHGAPEDQLRAPLEGLVYDIGEFLGLPRRLIAAVGETSLADLKTRPDYAITLNAALVGFIEVKAPGKGADPRRFTDKHDREQWDKLKTLPNLIYTDGNAFSLWRNGDLEGKVIALEGDVQAAGRKLTAPSGLKALFADFFQWQPQPPKSAAALAELTARLCRLLRDEVTEQLAQGPGPLTNLATDWRKLLFPSATDGAFADGYAQAVTFGLLMARARRIPLSDGLDRVASELRQTNTLIGTALRLLTDDAENQETLKTSLATLMRVLDAVHWDVISKGDPETWLYFYETFLNTYDSALRRKTGSYYTPPEVVMSMVRLVDEALKSSDYFGLVEGLASPEVTVADPATGTGTYLLGVLRRVAETTEADQGPGAVPGVIEAAMSRLIGFEIQLGPFAVAQLRLLAELQELVGHAFTGGSELLRLFVTDTLGNPFVEDEYIPQILMPLGESRRQANRIKRQERITVVIGNPPYKDKAKGLGGWIENGSANRPGQPVPLMDWMPPPEWNVGAHAKHLRNLYVYFWRWAAWKVFGDGDPADIQDREKDHTGIVCFITVAGFLNGPGFQKMRADLRAEADEIWVIDCSPEGFQPPVPSRIFQGVQQPVCIVMALRKRQSGASQPARVLYRTLDGETREDKFAAFAGISLGDDGWVACPKEPRAPFLPKASGAWGDFVHLEDLFSYNGAGVMPGRVWVIAPDRQSLEARWDALVGERDVVKKEALFHPHLLNGKPGDKHLNKELKSGLHGHEFRANAVATETGNCIAPVRYGFRSFDRQWIIPDGRVINRANPTLWENFSEKQVFLTALHRSSPSNGPAISFTASVCDLDHYKGSFGGRVFPLWADSQSGASNVKTAFVDSLAEQLGTPVSGRQVMAYLAVVMAHPGYTRRFQDDLVQPGLRLPLTRDAALFAEAVALGEKVIWLHTFGERYTDPSKGRPAAAPRMPTGEGPLVPREGAIPSDPPRMPDRIDYDDAKHRLLVGEGFIDNVPREVWQYEVSGKQVLVHWFSYRKKDRSRPVIGERRPPSPLEKIQSDRWLAEYTTELLNVLHVLGRLVALESRQADLLTRICNGPLISVETLRTAGAFDVTRKDRGGTLDARQDALL
ncbi:MAG: N-6 DNA methylase [Candidatus Tectomicrobia bacterium]|nr:N-6 DNA methylase [Candidatus Tectomicrobia bacterium]